jgi:hypothetical protein
MVQASAGTGKSFLTVQWKSLAMISIPTLQTCSRCHTYANCSVEWLSTVYLWCIVHGKATRACAPTGIAAANVEIQGTSVSAMTLHALFDLDTDLKTGDGHGATPLSSSFDFYSPSTPRTYLHPQE